MAPRDGIKRGRRVEASSPTDGAAKRRQLNLTLDAARWALLQAEADERGEAPTKVATRMLTDALEPRADFREEADLPAIGEALFELDRRLTALGRAQHNATIRLLVALGVPRAEVRAFAERHLQSPGAALPPTDAAHDGRPQEDGSDA